MSPGVSNCINLEVSLNAAVSEGRRALSSALVGKSQESLALGLLVSALTDSGVNHLVVGRSLGTLSDQQDLGLESCLSTNYMQLEDNSWKLSNLTAMSSELCFWGYP